MTEPPEQRRLVTVFGGTGFIGQRFVRHLLERGCAVRAGSRHPERADRIFEADEHRPEATLADVRDEASTSAALTGAYGAINAVSLYTEHGDATFHSIHVEAAERIARIANQQGIKQFVHMSGIGSDPNSPSNYVRARGEGEIAVRSAFPEAAIIRSAVMVGPNDAFLTKIVQLLRRLPLYPMFGNGATRLQPVYVEDVGEAGARLVTDPALRGNTYELGGPQIYSYRELLETVADYMELRSTLIPMPFGLWLALARIAEFAPGTPLTRNQVELMMADNVASPPGLREVGIEATAIEEVLPQLM